MPNDFVTKVLEYQTCEIENRRLVLDKKDSLAVSPGDFSSRTVCRTCAPNAVHAEF